MGCVLVTGRRDGPPLPIAGDTQYSGPNQDTSDSNDHASGTGKSKKTPAVTSRGGAPASPSSPAARAASHKSKLEDTHKAGELNVSDHKVANRVKTDEDLALIRDSLKKNSWIRDFFSSQEKEVERIVNAVDFYRFRPDETVCQQGTQGTYFFVVHRGAFDVLVNGKVVNSLARGQSFGEIALIHNCPRSASVVAKNGKTSGSAQLHERTSREHLDTKTTADTDEASNPSPPESTLLASTEDSDSRDRGGEVASCSELWGIPNHEFRDIMRQISQAQYDENMKLLNKVPLFDMLAPQQKNRICDGVQVTMFREAVQVCRKGEQADSLYVVKSGEITSSDGELYRSGDYFGTDALLSDSATHPCDFCVTDGAPAVCIEVKRSRIEMLDQGRELTSNFVVPPAHLRVAAGPSGGAANPAAVNLTANPNTSSTEQLRTPTTTLPPASPIPSPIGSSSSSSASPTLGSKSPDNSTTRSRAKFTTALQELHFFHMMERVLAELEIVDQHNLRTLCNHATMVTLEVPGAVQNLEYSSVGVAGSCGGGSSMPGTTTHGGSASSASSPVTTRPGAGAEAPTAGAVESSATGAVGGPRFLVVFAGEVTLEDLDTGENVLLKPGKAYGTKHLLDPRLPFRVQIKNTSSGSTILATFPMHAFENLELGNADFNSRLVTLKKVTIFRYLSEQQTSSMVRAFKELSGYKQGDYVFKQGDVGDRFYIIKEGEVRAELADPPGKVLRTMGRSDYFGERALMFQEPRSASIIVNQTGTVLWSLEKSDFFTILSSGPGGNNMLSHLEYRIQLQNTFLKFENLTEEKCVGRGTFGTVKLVHENTTKVRYALKCVRKSVVRDKKQEQSIRMEREILAENDHPFIVHLVKTFRDRKFLYFLTELVTGGELYDAIRELDLLTREQAQFYLGSLTLAIDYLHEKNIAYRDLKPENVLLDSQGYIKVIDFGCAKKLGESGKAFTLLGTPHYMAPEIILGRGYSQNADVWSMGVCLYEFMCGPLPFGADSGDDQLIVFKEILTGRLHFPDYVEDVAAMGLMKRLLCRTPEMRIGCSLRGFWDIKEHPFFEDFSFDQLMGRGLAAPLVPSEECYSSDVGGGEFENEPDISFDWEGVFE